MIKLPYFIIIINYHRRAYSTRCSFWNTYLSLHIIVELLIVCSRVEHEVRHDERSFQGGSNKGRIKKELSYMLTSVLGCSFMLCSSNYYAILR